MASDGSSTNGILYGIIGALAVVVVGGGVYMYQSSEKLAETPPVAAAPPIPAPAPPPVAAAPRPAPPPVVAAPVTPPPVTPAPVTPAGPTAAQIEQVRALVIDARRAIARADFQAADRALDQAERIDARSPDVVAARLDLRDARQRAVRLDNRVDSLVASARAAIARRDYAAADRLLDDAERIDRRDRDVLQARAELEAAQRPDPRPLPPRRN